MATGNSSGLGSSLFRGALHGNTSNTGGANSSNQHHHHHHSGHQLQVAGPSHHVQHLATQQPQLQHHQPQQPQPQPSSASQPPLSMGATIFSPEKHQGQSTPGSPDHMTTLMAKLWFDHNVESSLRDLKKEEHEKRIRDLRKQLEHITDTNWKYSPVEKYIGQQ